jgi:S-formylglutathione hydrolase FrmB
MTFRARALAVASAVAVVVTACAPGARQASAPALPRGTMLHLTMAAPAMGERERNVRVYLPASYAAADSGRHYPVVYLLHGWPGSEANLPGGGHAADTADSLIATRTIPDIIMVFPYGGGEGIAGRSFWINSRSGKKRLEDYVTQDLVQWVDARYRTIRSASGRGIIGISDGGTAAFNLTFKHPELFSACGGHSADYVLQHEFGTGGFLGHGPEADRLLEDNSPAHYAAGMVERLRTKRIYFDCGRRDGSMAHSRAFDSLLTRLDVPHEFHEFEGSHTWGYWRTHLKQSLTAVAGALH